MSRETTTVILLLLGLGLAGLSLFWSAWRTGQGEWSPADAERFQTVSREVHRLASAADRPEAKARLETLRSEFGELRGRLETARGRGAAEAAWMRVAGFVAVAAALGLRLAPRGKEKRRA